MKSAILIIGIMLISVCVFGEEERILQQIPDGKALKKSETAIRDYFKDGFADTKAHLASDLLLHGSMIKDDSAIRFQSLQMAIDVGAKRNDFMSAWNSFIIVRSEFKVGLKWQIQCLESLYIAAQPKASDKQLVDSVSNEIVVDNLAIVDKARLSEDFDKAAEIINILLSFAPVTNNKEQRARIEKQRAEILIEQAAYAHVKEFLQQLFDDPTDPKANLAAGKYYCFSRNNFAKGLPLLALGSDQKLSAVAKMDISDPINETDKLVIANLWWELPMQLSQSERILAKSRATYWYKGIQNSQNQTIKETVAKRLAEFDTISKTSSQAAITKPVKAADVKVKISQQQAENVLLGKYIRTEGKIDENTETYLLEPKGKLTVGYGRSGKQDGSWSINPDSMILTVKWTGIEKEHHVEFKDNTIFFSETVVLRARGQLRTDHKPNNERLQRQP